MQRQALLLTAVVFSIIATAASASIELGIQEAENGNLDAALAIFQDTLDQDPEDAAVPWIDCD